MPPDSLNLEPLFAPRSVAVMGASPRPSPGRYIVETLQNFGFTGDIYPVNPNYDEVAGVACFDDLADLPASPDIVVFCVSPERTMDGFRKLPPSGAGAAVIFGGGYGEAGDDGREMQREMVGICREAGIALCGPNCMGVISPHARSATYLQIGSNREALAGNVGLISQSGSICISMLSDVSRFGYSLVASTGNEAVVSAAAVMEYMVDLPETKVIACFTETIAEPERYVAALDKAADAGKPVVVLKVGKTKRTKDAIATHTGGMAGDDRVFSEILRAHRTIEVSEFDELIEVLAVCQGRVWPTGRRLSVVTSSGGAAELMLDIGETAGLELPPLPEVEFEAAREFIGDFAGDGNPLDAWGNGNFRENMPYALSLVGKTESTDAVLLCYDNDDSAPMGNVADYLARVDIIEAASRESEKPHYQLTLRPGLRIAEQIERFRALGIPPLVGVRQGLGAIDKLARWNGERLPARKPEVLPTVAFEGISMSGRATVHERDCKKMMSALGLTITREQVARDVDAAVAAAEEIGYPVVMKALSDDIPHKSEHGLVAVGVEDADDVRRVWSDLQHRLTSVNPDADILIQEMVSGGVEVFAGVAHHPGFGHVLAFGLGGIDIELDPDFSLRKLPLRTGDAEAMIGEIRGAGRLGAYRGRAACDVESLTTCLYAISDLMAAAGSQIRELDLNPIKVMRAGSGCVIVDALIVPHEPEGDAP